MSKESLIVTTPQRIRIITRELCSIFQLLVLVLQLYCFGTAPYKQQKDFSPELVEIKPEKELFATVAHKVIICQLPWSTK